jgi:hypothetical protein
MEWFKENKRMITIIAIILVLVFLVFIMFKFWSYTLTAILAFGAGYAVAKFAKKSDSLPIV